MAIESKRRLGAEMVERVLAPVGWMQQGIARLLGWFNQERWTNLLTILGLVLGNLVILLLLLQGQDNRAIAFVILVLVAPLAFLVPELSIVVFISAGAGLFVNAMYFAAGPGGGTGERTLILTFLGILSARALYEYVRLPAARRPKLFSWFTLILSLFWIYYMAHVITIYLFHPDAPSTDPLESVFGFDTRGIFRYFDFHMIWVGIFPLIILLHDYQRARRVLILLTIITGIGVVGIVWDYISPLPEFFKILFQLRASGETEEGYRIRDPASLYLILVGFFAALYALGHSRGIRYNVPLMVYIAFSLLVVLITKNRALWMGMMVFAPFALFWKPPSVLLRQMWLFGVAAMVLVALTLHPRVNELTRSAFTEALQRWSRNYAYGGDPRLDPSYQKRVREYEAFTFHWARLAPLERLFGMGLEARYKHYTSLADLGYQGPRFQRIYFEKVYMHFSWVARMHHIGYIGITLLGLTLLGFLLRAAVVFLRTQDIVCRALLMGVAGGTIGLLAFDVLHQTLRTSTAIPVIMLWSFVEAIPHWQRTGQLPTSSEMGADGV